MQTRRSFLATVGAGVAGLSGATPLLGAFDRRWAAAKLERVGIQLYTVRNAFNADPVATVTNIAKIGYKEVEFAGYGGKSPVEIRDLLKANGLTSPSTHIGMGPIQANPQKTFEDSKTIGHQWVTVPSLPGGPKATVDDWKRIAAQFNTAAKQAKDAGLRFAFHNHNAEFRKIGDEVPLEILLKETDPALVDYEMDIHWVVVGGGNPIDLLTRYPKRFKMLHAKDALITKNAAGENVYRMVEVGAGSIDFKSILALATKDGVKNVFVEHDNPADPMASAKASYDHLSKIEF
jgi:sugar phosphate isomerase/epimerase